MTHRKLHPGSYYGARGTRVETPCATVAEVVHSHGRRLPLHDHARPYLSLLLDGDYVERNGSREWRYRAFDTGFHPARCPHQDEIGRSGARFLCVEIGSDALHGAEVRMADHPRLLAADTAVQLLALYRHLALGTLSPLVVESTVWALCAEFGDTGYRRERNPPRWLRRCVEMIADEYAQSLTVQRIANQVGVHPVHLSREFRRRFGETLGEHANKVRIQRACPMIADATVPLSAVAAASGFADQSHFCRVFKSLVGCTPSQFRRLGSPSPLHSCARRYSM
jgi:AraC family transcriptional regulator